MSIAEKPLSVNVWNVLDTRETHFAVTFSEAVCIARNVTRGRRISLEHAAHFIMRAESEAAQKWQEALDDGREPKSVRKLYSFRGSKLLAEYVVVFSHNERELWQVEE